MVSFSVYYGIALVGRGGFEPPCSKRRILSALSLTNFSISPNVWSVHEESNLSPPSNFLGTALEELCWEWTQN